MLLKNANFSLIENEIMWIFLLPTFRGVREYGVTTFPQLSADIPVNMKLIPTVTTSSNFLTTPAVVQEGRDWKGLQLLGGLV